VLKPKVRKLVDWIVGAALIMFGIAAGLVPMLPGWLFVLAGLAVLSSHSRWARTLHDRLLSLGRRARKTVWRDGTDPRKDGRQSEEE